MSSRDEARERTRHGVIASAGECFRAHGFDATTVRDIAARAGVSVGSVMGVGDKQALLVAVFDQDIAAVHEARTHAQAPGPLPSTAAESLVALVLPFARLFVENDSLARGYAAILVSGLHRSKVFGELAVLLVNEFQDVLLRFGCDPERSASLARAIYFAYLGVLFAASGQERHPATIESLSDELRAVFAAIAPHQEVSA